MGKGFINCLNLMMEMYFLILKVIQEMDRPFEYLHGLYYKDKGKFKFKDLWAKKFDREVKKIFLLSLQISLKNVLKNTLMLIFIIMHPMRRGLLES